MNFDVALTAAANRKATSHLLQHYKAGNRQEDVCFALWRPSTGRERLTALIDEIIIPDKDDRNLHGNASIAPEYTAKAVRRAYAANAGLSIMHSHPYPGWQNLSPVDKATERDILAPPAQATGMPLVGMTIGSDGQWSGRFWTGNTPGIQLRWCEKVRIIDSNTYRIHYNDYLSPPPRRRELLKRTYDSWGVRTQNDLSRMHIGIVGLGSVGAIVAEAMARIGIRTTSLIDPDLVETHNLDRLLHGSIDTIGKLKVQLAKAAVERHATAQRPVIHAIPLSIHQDKAYRQALDCDLIFSCVDRPVARDVLNFIANAHLIPVVDCGVNVQKHPENDLLDTAHWRAHIISPEHQCLRCNGQYSTSMVSAELDGSLDNPSYIQNLPVSEQVGNQNVFPFSLSIAAMSVNLMLRYIISPDWWPDIQQQEYQFLTGRTHIRNEFCLPHCAFRNRRAKGDMEQPSFLDHQYRQQQ